MRKARAVRGSTIAMSRSGSAQQHPPELGAPAAAAAYRHGLVLCLAAANRLAQGLTDLVLEMEHCRLRQRLGRCLISSVRHAAELERLLGAAPNNMVKAQSESDPAALLHQFAGSSVRQPGQRLSIIGLVRMTVASQHAMLQHLCAIALSAGRGADVSTLHGMREECGILDNRLHVAAQEIAVSETPSRLPVAPSSALRIRSGETHAVSRMQLKLVGRDTALAPSSAIRLHWRIAES